MYPAAAVRVTNVETDVTREATTDAEGGFSVSAASAGQIPGQVQKEGFRPVIRENINLEVNQVARLDFALELGAVTESVQVTSAAPLIESDTSAIGQVIENKQITELPLNGRNFVQLATLGPGVTGVGFSASGTIMSGTRPDDSRPGSELFSNGNREGSNNFLYDGIDNNERLTLSITLRPSVEAVREFKIQTNMFAAEQGRNAGATVNVISKSGTNQFHGSAYEFLRNDKFDARDFFAPPGQAKPAYRQNQFGASFGGPVVKNKVFFFTITKASPSAARMFRSTQCLPKRCGTAISARCATSTTRSRFGLIQTIPAGIFAMRFRTGRFPRIVSIQSR